MQGHSNIVRYFGGSDSSTLIKGDGNSVKVCYLVFESLPNGDLYDYIADCGHFKASMVRLLARQLLFAVHSINMSDISNRDLKLENILIDSKYNIKIVDFGFATSIQGSDGSGWNQSQLGTQSYMAPEIHLKQSYQGQLVDLFALGVIIFVLYTGAKPF